MITKKLANILAQEYPYYYRGKTLWAVSGILFLMSLFFNYLFEPFHVYTPEHKMDYFYISLLHSLTPVFLLFVFSLFKIPNTITEQWNLKKELFLVTLFLLFIGMTQFLMRDMVYNNPNNWSWQYLFEEIRNTFLVGGLFLLILIPLNFNRLYARNTKNALAINAKRNNLIASPTTIKIDDLSFNVNHLLFVKSDGNYVELFFIDGNKSLKRKTIKDLELALQQYPSIIKTHRSYLVNTNHIVNISGNAQGYKLELKNYAEKIPVSRNMIAPFNKKIKSQ